MKITLSSKRHHYFARVSIFLVMVALIAGIIGCGNTTQDVEIWDWYDLDAIRNNLGGSYLVMNDLDSNSGGYTELASPTANEGKGWQPIGTFDAPFTGSLDGQGYEIRDLVINRPDEDDVGLFGFVDEGGVVQNVGVVNADVTGEDSVGGLVGANGGSTVNNSYSTGSVTGTEGVGGLVGVNDGGNVRNSHYNYEEVLINGENIITIGALFGEDFEQWLANDKFLDVNEMLVQENGYYVINNVSDFKQLLAFGQDSSLKFRLKNVLDLATAPNFYIPYLAGEFDGNGHKISNLSFNFDFVSQAQVGLFGYLASGGKVTQVGVENVNITADCIVGGLVGDNRGTVSNSYATGSVTGEDVTGGLVGYNVGTVTDSYSSGHPTSKYTYVGGLIGYNVGTVTNSYSSGNVTGDEYVGGLVGENDGTVSDSFWDTETSGQATSDGGTGKNTAQMQDIATFSGAGWDIIAVAPGSTNTTYTWNIVDDETYPFLSWQS